MASVDIKLNQGKLLETDMQNELLGLWRKFLKNDDVSIDDDFFEKGGRFHSGDGNADGAAADRGPAASRDHLVRGGVGPGAAEAAFPPRRRGRMRLARVL